MTQNAERPPGEVPSGRKGNWQSDAANFADATAAIARDMQWGNPHHHGPPRRTGTGLPTSRTAALVGSTSRPEPEVVNEYATDMLNGASFPPVVLYQDDDGLPLWLGDGFHRVDAARKIERETMLAEVRHGTARDAILHAVGANAAHGLRRTQADKRRAVERLLRDPEWALWSLRRIADVAKVDHKTVAKIKAELTGEIPIQARRGEFPEAAAKPSSQDLVGAWLATIKDADLVAECRRRHLIVEAGDD